MLDLLVVCEGQTEREFCRQVVAPHVAVSGVALAGTLVGKPQRKRGGIRPWQTYRGELLRLGRERSERHLAVLVDYHAMPDSWPGRPASRGMPAALSIAVGGGAANHVAVAQRMIAIKIECGGSVEQIDDSPQTAPSKRLIEIIPSYDKVAWGVTAVADVSVPVLRGGCPWLDRWLNRITGLGGS